MLSKDVSEVTRFKAVEERKNRFMAVVSHELRSPLHGITGLVTSLIASEEQEARQRPLKMIKSCSERLLELVITIMDSKL